MYFFSKLRASTTDCGSSLFLCRKSRWCAPPFIITATKESEIVSVTPPPDHGSRSPLLYQKLNKLKSDKLSHDLNHQLCLKWHTKWKYRKIISYFKEHFEITNIGLSSLSICLLTNHGFIYTSQTMWECHEQSELWESQFL